MALYSYRNSSYGKQWAKPHLSFICLLKHTKLYYRVENRT
jgi:hypothetical protein